ncbi:MAG: ribonuclease E/G, partial [Allosphingosinicella sp.]
STREHNIEQTAYATNIEAANEIARQHRQRDMAGLVVIDFIDMESNGHIRKVEKAMKEALKNDRARIQVGRISSFGLMEMSRQRLRTGVLEASTKPCQHCEGTGLMRTAASSGLSALRMLEDEAARGRGSRIVLRAGREAAVYVLNRKRAEIGEIEARYGVQIEVLIEESFEGAKMAVESLGPPPTVRPRVEAPAAEPEEDEVYDEAEEDEAEPEADEDEHEDEEVEAPRRAGGRRPAPASAPSRRDDEEAERGRKRRRRRGRRGGRRRPGEGEEQGEGGEAVAGTEAEVGTPAMGDVPAEPVHDEVSAEPSPASVAEPTAEGEEEPRKARRRPRARRKAGDAVEAAPVEAAPAQASEPEPAPAPEPAPEPEAEAPPAKPKRTRRKKADAAPPEAAEEAASPAAPAAANDAALAKAPAADEGAEGGDADDEGGPRRGWWQRTFGA